MFEAVVSNLASPDLLEVALVAPTSFELQPRLSALEDVLGCKINLVEIDFLTDGPAISAKLGVNALNSDAPLVIANSDQFLDFQMAAWLKHIEVENSQGSVLLMEDNDPKWSYAQISGDWRITKIVEKEVISKYATCGVYHFASNSLFLDSLEETIGDDLRVNGEFYVGPLYNKMIQRGLIVSGYNLGPVSEVMFGLGVPEDYEYFRSIETNFDI